MSVGIECLLTREAARAADLAQQLDALNRSRREIEAGMQDSALALLDTLDVSDSWTVCLHDASWHQGVIGILAARLRERFHRPAIAFANAGAGQAKGSGRSIAGLHLRDALDLITKRYPGLILRFGGHAAAAGLTVRAADVPAFAAAFEQTVRDLVEPADLDRLIETDGSLPPADIDLAFAEALSRPVWGQGFREPAFCDEFGIAEQRVVGGKHLKLRLRTEQPARVFEAIVFGHTQPLPARIRCIYRVQVNEYNSTRSVQLLVDHWQPIA
jgi:single-stranded-DNA-specific exonuclease